MRPDPTLADLPLRPELAGEQPYGAPQIPDVVLLNTNENPYPPNPGVVADMVAAIAAMAQQVNRYPDREALGLRSDLARYLGHGLDASRIWAANGSNEVMTHVLGAFAGPGRRVLTFAPTYSMYPEYARNTHSEYLVEPRRPDFGIDPDAALAAIGRHAPSVVILTTPNNPTGTTTPLEVTCAIVLSPLPSTQTRPQGCPSCTSFGPPSTRVRGAAPAAAGVAQTAARASSSAAQTRATQACTGDGIHFRA